MAQYTKFPNQISAQDGWHINYPMDKSASEMKKICDEQLGCQGYQTGGGGNTIFYGLYQAGNWTRVNDGRSLYVKKPPVLPKYKFLQNRDTQGNDITHIGGKRPIKEVAAACDADPDCKALIHMVFSKEKVHLHIFGVIVLKNLWVFMSKILKNIVNPLANLMTPFALTFVLEIHHGVD